MGDFLKALHSGRVLLMDGAMGTELIRAGVPRDACLEELNLTQPEVVQSVHRAYVEAGADVLLTNTFQANPVALANHNLLHEMTRIWETGLAHARSVAAECHFIVADIGPFGLQDLAYEERLAKAAMIGQLLRSAGAVLVETCSNKWDFVWFSTFKVNTMDLPLANVLVSFSFEKGPPNELRTHDRLIPEACARLARRYNAKALGVNCGRDIGRAEILEIVKRYRSVTDLPLFVRPNAGTPQHIDGQWVYPETPESMAGWLPELFKAGVVMVGGCCGTTPAHIAAFRKVVDAWNAARIPS